MAVDAKHCLVRTFQREACRRMIERPQFLPLPGVVTGLASFFGVMGVGVTSRTALGCEMILARGCGCSAWQSPMAILAYDSRVSPVQSEAGLRVIRGGECRGPEGGLRMTRVAVVEIRCGRKLCRVRILMALYAGQSRHFVVRLGTFRCMAFRTFERSVLAHQRECTFSVLVSSKQ